MSIATNQGCRRHSDAGTAGCSRGPITVSIDDGAVQIRSFTESDLFGWGRAALEHLTNAFAHGVMLVGNLPDVTARIAEAGGADPPGTIHRPVQRFKLTTALQFVDRRIHVVYTERELEPDTRVRSCDGRRRDSAEGASLASSRLTSVSPGLKRSSCRLRRRLRS